MTAAAVAMAAAAQVTIAVTQIKKQHLRQRRCEEGMAPYSALVERLQNVSYTSVVKSRQCRAWLLRVLVRLLCSAESARMIQQKSLLIIRSMLCVVACMLVIIMSLNFFERTWSLVLKIASATCE